MLIAGEGNYFQEINGFAQKFGSDIMSKKGHAILSIVLNVQFINIWFIMSEDSGDAPIDPTAIHTWSFTNLTFDAATDDISDDSIPYADVSDTNFIPKHGDVIVDMDDYESCTAVRLDWGSCAGDAPNTENYEDCAIMSSSQDTLLKDTNSQVEAWQTYSQSSIVSPVYYSSPLTFIWNYAYFVGFCMELCILVSCMGTWLLFV